MEKITLFFFLARKLNSFLGENSICYVKRLSRYELYVMIACCMSPWGFILGHSWFWAVLMPMLCFCV